VNWEQIYREYRPAMIAVAMRRVCERPDLDAGDLVHDAFAAMLSNPPNPETEWLGFLTDLIAAALLVRAEPMSIEALADDSAFEPALTEDTATIAVRRVAAGEVRHRILRVMNYMTERQQEITRLRLFEGLSVGEIAAVMNTSSSNISQIVIRCLTKLAPVITQFDTIDQHDVERLRPPRRVN
jgi:RNA polymerase sigma factor (sigma-70 family)